MRADLTHTRGCKPFCEKSLTLPANIGVSSGSAFKTECKSRGMIALIRMHSKRGLEYNSRPLLLSIRLRMVYF